MGTATSFTAVSGETLFAKTGLVLFGPENGPIIRGAQSSAQLYDIPLAVFRSAEIATRFPAFAASAGDIAVFEPGAGWLAVERCVRTMAALAKAQGATILENTPVKSWSRAGGSVSVETVSGIFKAKRLIITAGVWSADFLPAVRGRIDVRRVPVGWFAPRSAAALAMPCFGFEGPNGFFYGFPPQMPRGLKIGLHLPGDPVADPAALDRSLRPGDAAPLEAFVAAHLPQIAPQITAHSVCMYEMSPDEHFIVDKDGEDVTYAAGFSGHGFKFAPVIGDVLAELALTGGTRHPVDFLRHRWAAS